MSPNERRSRYDRLPDSDDPPTMQDGTAAASPSPPFPRISKSLEDVKPSYDCVVIGSGYGGGIAASRMARSGQSVCVLERGQEKWPGEYPTSFLEAYKELHVSGKIGKKGKRGQDVTCGKATGMYHIVTGSGRSAVVCNGLGGGSLINANVFLEADESTLSSELWPSEIREDPTCLSKYYQQVRDVLEPEPYPTNWPTLDKATQLQQQAHALGLDSRFYKVPQMTRFRSGRNSVGLQMSPSTLTGQDTTGINDGSKTTTLVTYLADAWNWGADIFCECEVRYIEKASDARGGYLVYFASHNSTRAKFHDDIYSELSWVHAQKAVFLGAGSIGTTEILLRSKAMGLSMSDFVGQGMSGNGDMLAFGYNTGHGVNAFGNPNPSSTNPVGPTITSIIDMRDKTGNPLDGYVIQDGAVPQALSTFVKTVLCTHATFSPSSKVPICQRMKRILSKWKQRLLHPISHRSTAQDTQVFLIMSHDSSQAAVRLDDDKPVYEFLGVGQNERVERILAPLRKVVEKDGARLIYNPLRGLWGNHQITVHPLGGARMSQDNSGRSGVTNHVGEVFVGQNSETHSGLIVVDGAAIPTALGVNPCATIAALAERSVAEFAKRHSLAICVKSNGTIDLHTPGSTQQLGLEPIISRTQTIKRFPNSISFTELLEGCLYSRQTMKLGNNTSSYERAYRMAKGRGEVARLLASIQLEQPTRMHMATRYKGTLSGTLMCPTIQGSPFMIHGGTVKLFQPDMDTSGTTKLVYDSSMTGVNGEELHFQGFKILDSSVSFSPRQLWRAMTNLNVTIVEKKGNASNVDSEYQTVATGLLKIRLGNFIKQLSTIAATGERLADRSKLVVDLSSHFARQMLSHFFLPLAPMQYVAVKPLVGFTNPTEPTETYRIEAKDGMVTKLLMWEPGPNHVPRDVFGIPVPIENLFMIPGAAVDHQIFALPTITTNAVNYFTRAGYRVFVIVHRIGQLETINQTGCGTTYDARLDIRAGFEQVRKIWGEEKIYTVAHCMGSVAFSCGLLDGTIPADWILGITCSQVFMNPIWSARNMAKAKFPVPLDKLYGSVAGQWFGCEATEGDGFLQGLINQLFRFLPEEKGERCSNASCHRTSFLFGRCWNHRNLNEETHRHIDKFFSGSNLTLMHLLMRMGRHGHVSTNGPTFEELTTDENLERLRGIPIFLFSGGDSDVLSPEATEKTYERLCSRFGLSAGGVRPGLQYRRRVIPGYGHLDCWMGRDAFKDVYPIVLDEIDRVVRKATWSYSVC